MIHPSGEGDEMYVDIGAYGVPKNPDFHAENTTRRIEAFVRKIHGWV